MAASSHPRSPVRPSAQPSVQYVGFEDVPGRRNYRLMVQVGDEVRELVVWIARDAFTQRAAAVQDGPAICFQRIQRALAEGGLDGDTTIAVTSADLAEYRRAREPQPSKRTPRRVYTLDEAPPSDDPA